MKILFGIQTEGSGHITQAIAIKQILNDNGYEVFCAMSGKKRKGFSNYFLNSFNIKTHDGFDFVFDKNGSMNIFRTVFKNVLKFPKLVMSFINICLFIKREKPNVIFNYYEPMIGLSAIFFPSIKYISFGHQYAMTSHFYPRVRGYYFQKLFLRILNYITSIRAKKVAMSYYEFSDENIDILPPILRKESYDLDGNKNEGFILVYLINQELIPQLISECKKHPNLKVECFVKLKNNFKNLPENLKINDLCGESFQKKMKICKAVVCSGGFETTSEAIYQNKPVLMIPIKNHFEQNSNSLDAYVHNFAVYSNIIDLSKIPNYQSGNKIWFDTYKEKLKNIFELYNIYI